MPTLKYKLAAAATLMTTELNSIANNGLAISSAYNNVQGGGGGDGYTLCDVELVVTYGSAPSASTGVSVWFLAAPDGTNYEDGGSGITPTGLPVVFGLRAVTTTQRITRRVALPWGLLKACVKNDGTGQAMAASGNTLSIRPVTLEALA